MPGAPLNLAKSLLSLAFLPGLAAASPAPVEVHGLEQPGFTALYDRAEIPKRIDAAWKQIEALLKLPEGPAPILYLYPFDASLQPARLSELQAKARATAEPPQSAEESAKMYARLLGLTYDVSLFGEDDADRGRVIQISPAFLYTRESEFERGFGLYVSSHEMMHYALNRAGIDPKFHHCLMVEKRGERESLLLEVLNEEIRRGWVNEFLKRPLPRAKGYWEDQQHCEAEAFYWERQEKNAGEAPAFRAEVKRLADSLP
jgi:hypothetical protein